MEGPSVVMCADGPALHVGTRVAEACGESMDVRAVMKQWECNEVQARQAFSLGLCKAVRVEVERGFATFLVAATGEHGLEWHYKLTPARAVSATLGVELPAADAAALANINVLCRGHSTDSATGLRPHVSGIALRLDGHTIDWAEPMRNHADPRVIEFPLFTNAAPLMTRWLRPGADLRVVIYFSSAPPATIRATEHVRIIADAVYFDDAALAAVLATARSSRAPTVTRWTMSPQPIMLTCADATPEVVATGALDAVPGYLALGAESMALLAEEDASDDDASSTGSKGSKGSKGKSIESDSDDEYVIPRYLVTAMAAVKAAGACVTHTDDAKPRTDIRPYLRPTGYACDRGGGGGAAGGSGGSGGSGGGGAAAYGGVGGGAASAPAPLLKFTPLYARTPMGSGAGTGAGVCAPATPSPAAATAAATVPDTPFWWNDPKAAPTEEQELDTYAREHAETVAAMGALSSMSIDTYVRLMRTRVRTCHTLKSEATSHVTEWRTLVAHADEEKEKEKDKAHGGDSASTNCDSAKLAAIAGAAGGGAGAVGGGVGGAGAVGGAVGGGGVGGDAPTGTSSPVHSS